MCLFFYTCIKTYIVIFFLSNSHFFSFSFNTKTQPEWTSIPREKEEEEEEEGEKGEQGEQHKQHREIVLLKNEQIFSIGHPEFGIVYQVQLVGK